MLHSANTKVRGRFSEKRRGLSHRCARNASAALENFVCFPEKTFSTASTRNGSQADRVLLRIVSSFAPKAQCDGAERAHYQVMATLRQFILGGATKSLIETIASDPLFTLTTNSDARP